MATNTAKPWTHDASEAQPARPPERKTTPLHIRGREAFLLATILVVAGVLRLILAARGWPYSNSDEANTGIMGIDILWHGARPDFTYGIHHVGALDAYLQAPFFLAFGPTNFAMHATTTALMLLFLFLLYRFTRLVYSPLVAVVTVLLLAIGPYQALFYGMRAGHYAQDMLVLGAALLWLIVLRLRRPAHAWACWALDLGIGFVAGLALWGTVLMLPFVAAGALALVGEGAYTWWSRGNKKQTLKLIGQGIATLGAAIVGMLPLIISFISTHGALLTEAHLAAGGAAPTGSFGWLTSLGQQLAGTFLIGLPLMLGGQTICAHCSLWPYPGTNLAFGQALPWALTGALFSLVALICWSLAAGPLMRSARYMAQHARRGPEATQIFGYPRYRARTWGRAMLVIGGGLTILLYLSTRSSYQTPDTSIRYISSIYLCTPLVADPLCRGAHRLWRWASTRQQGLALARPGAGAFLATGLLLALFAINTGGAVHAFQESSNTQRYGVPAGTRETQLLSFLETHHVTRFYTTWWVCYRLRFDAQENVDCAVVNNNNAFALGFNPLQADVENVAAAPHPAYLFDLTTTEATPHATHQIAERIAAHDPRFAGYTSTTLNGYLIYYYDG